MRLSSAVKTERAPPRAFALDLNPRTTPGPVENYIYTPGTYIRERERRSKIKSQQHKAALRRVWFYIYNAAAAAAAVHARVVCVYSDAGFLLEARV
jgi:hypothetical protein